MRITIMATTMLTNIRMRTATVTEVSYDYLRDPAAIYRRSFALIREAADLSVLARDLRPVALRLIHANGDPSIIDDLIASRGAATRGRQALAADAPLLVDAAMVAAGITAYRARCFLNDKRVPGLAKRLDTTRSAAAVELWRPHLDGAVVAIGNAPTALFRLLEIIAAGAPRPALILGFPVGFVGAAEAKAALAGNPWRVPFIALRGRRGGSALAAAAANALAARPQP
jgi:precorrin isomerase